MEWNETIMETVEEYLKGNLNETEKSDFENLLENDNELRKAYQTHIENIAVVQAAGMGITRNKIGNLNEGIIRHEKNRRIRFRSLLAAASITILMAVVFFLRFQGSSTPDNLYLTYYEPYDAVMNIRGENDDSHQKWTEAVRLYNDGNYEQAGVAFTGISSWDNRFQYPAKFYATICDLETGIGGLDKTVIGFKSVMDTSPMFSEQAEWYLAMSYLKYEAFSETKEVLNSIAGSESHYKKVEAKKLFLELD